MMVTNIILDNTYYYQNKIIKVLLKMLKNIDLKKVDEKKVYEIIENILKINNIFLDKKVLRKYFKNMNNFILCNIKDNIILNNNDLKFYIINELNLQIDNNEYLFNKIFNNKYCEINNNYKIVQIE